MSAPGLSLDRIGKITGSRVAGILNLSPYNTRDEVLREMVREFHWADAEFTGNFITEYGKEHERDGITEYELQRGVNVENHGEDQLTVVKQEMRLAVTPDGWVSDTADGDGLVEVKAPWRGLYNTWRDRPDYEAQMRLQCFTAEREWADFVVWRHEATPISRMYLDRDRDGDKIDWMASVWPELEKFLEEFDSIVESEELSAPFLEPIQDRRTDVEWTMAEATYWDLVYEQERAAEQLREAKAQLEALAGDKSTKGARIHLVYIPASPGGGGGRGTISYKNAAEDLAKRLELSEDAKNALYEKHRGKPSAGSRGSRASFTYRRIAEKES